MHIKLLTYMQYLWLTSNSEVIKFTYIMIRDCLCENRPYGTFRVSLFYGTECSIALLSGTEQLFNISLHENSSCLGL